MIEKISPTPIFTGRHQRSGYAVETYVLPGEAGYVIPLLLFVPEGTGPRDAIIYIHPGGKSAALAGGDIERLYQKGLVVAVPDLAGTGETKNSRGDLRSLQYMALMIDRCMVGLHAGDVMRIRQFLRTRPEQHEIRSITAVGVGTMSAAVLHAAALDADLQSVILVEPSLSYRSIVTNRLYAMDLVEIVPGALTAYDLPDLLGAVAPRRAVLIAPVNHMRTPAGPSVIEGELAFSREIFARTKAAAHLRIEHRSVRPSDVVEWSFGR